MCFAVPSGSALLLPSSLIRHRNAHIVWTKGEKPTLASPKIDGSSNRNSAVGFTQATSAQLTILGGMVREVEASGADAKRPISAADFETAPVERGGVRRGR